MGERQQLPAPLLHKTGDALGVGFRRRAAHDGSIGLVSADETVQNLLVAAHEASGRHEFRADKERHLYRGVAVINR